MGREIFIKAKNQIISSGLNIEESVYEEATNDWYNQEDERAYIFYNSIHCIHRHLLIIEWILSSVYFNKLHEEI